MPLQEHFMHMDYLSTSVMPILKYLTFHIQLDALNVCRLFALTFQLYSHFSVDVK